MGRGESSGKADRILYGDTRLPLRHSPLHLDTPSHSHGLSALIDAGVQGLAEIDPAATPYLLVYDATVAGGPLRLFVGEGDAYATKQAALGSITVDGVNIPPVALAELTESDPVLTVLSYDLSGAVDEIGTIELSEYDSETDGERPRLSVAITAHYHHLTR